MIAFINGGSADATAAQAYAFRKGLGETGYVEGHNVTVEYHWLEGQYDRLPALMADLVRRRVAVIATPGSTPAAIAAKAATATIPIVFGVAEDPVKTWSGRQFRSAGRQRDRRQFFRWRNWEPSDWHSCMNWSPRLFVSPCSSIRLMLPRGNHIREVQEAARSIGLQIYILNASTSREIDAAFASLRANAPMPSSSLATHSSSAAACNLPPWPRAIGFLRPMLIAKLSKSAG